MGVRDLLPNLRDITTVVHVAEYCGMTVGVDASDWLHKSAYGRDRNRWRGGSAGSSCLAYCLPRVRLLLDHGAVPYVVFDGASLPQKRATQAARRRGQHADPANGARRVTHEMAAELAAALAAEGVRFVVAPYEADAQLAYLSRTGAVDVVVSEDGDCLPYGCRKVMFKLDPKKGTGHEIALRNLDACADPLDFDGWSADNFLDLCILAGCDYLNVRGAAPPPRLAHRTAPQPIPSVGPKTAHRFVREQRTTDDLLAWLATNYASRLPAGYCARFRAARAIFRHQTVFDAASGTTVPLTPLQPSAWADVAFLGAHLPAEIACGVATSRLHPVSHTAFGAPLEEEPADRPSAPAAAKRRRHGESATKPLQRDRFQSGLINGRDFELRQLLLTQEDESQGWGGDGGGDDKENEAPSAAAAAVPAGSPPPTNKRRRGIGGNLPRGWA